MLIPRAITFNIRVWVCVWERDAPRHGDVKGQRETARTEFLSRDVFLFYLSQTVAFLNINTTFSLICLLHQMNTLSFAWFLNLLPCFARFVRSSSDYRCRLLHRVAEHYNPRFIAPPSQVFPTFSTPTAAVKSRKGKHCKLVITCPTFFWQIPGVRSPSPAVKWKWLCQHFAINFDIPNPISLSEV